MAWVLADVRKQKLTLRVAKKFSEMTALPNERGLNKKRLRRLRKKVSEHGALPFRWASAEVVENGLTFRVNGQHTSTMFSSDPGLIKDTMFVTVEQYLCDTMGDLADLYGQIDSSESSRNVGDINKSRAAVIPKLGDCDKRIINLAVTALSREKWGVMYTQQLKEDRAALLEDSPKFVLFLQDIKDNLTDSDWKVLRRGPIASAMLSTWRKNMRDAKTFWLAVARLDGTDSKSADRVLGKYLMRTGVTIGRPSAAQRIGSVEPHDTMYSRCIVGWNAWRRRKPTALRFHRNKTPVAV